MLTSRKNRNFYWDNSPVLCEKRCNFNPGFASARKRAIKRVANALKIRFEKSFTYQRRYSAADTDGVGRSVMFSKEK